MSSKSPAAADQQVGASMRMRRISLEISQERLATQLGISFQQVQKYEKGTNRISAGRLQSIASILGVSVSTLFGTPDVDDATSPTADIVPMSLQAIKLLKAYQQIESEDVRRGLLALVLALAPR